MSDQDAPVASFDDVVDRIQDALRAVGEVERAVGDLGDETVRNLTRNDLNAAVEALQGARQRLAQSIGGR